MFQRKSVASRGFAMRQTLGAMWRGYSKCRSVADAFSTARERGFCFLVCGVLVGIFAGITCMVASIAGRLDEAPITLSLVFGGLTWIFLVGNVEKGMYINRVCSHAAAGEPVEGRTPN